MRDRIERQEEGNRMPEVPLVKNTIKGIDNQMKSFVSLLK